jgi:cation transport ATPase
MAIYDDYLEELKRIADDMIGKHIVPLENEIESLSAELIKQNQENNGLSTKLNELRQEHYVLSNRWQERERNSYRRERQRMESAEERKRILLSIFIAALSGVLIVFIFASLTKDSNNLIKVFAVVSGTLFFIIGLISDKYAADKFQNGCNFGCGGLIASAITAAILVALLPSYTVSIIFGVIFSIIIGFYVSEWL